MLNRRGPHIEVGQTRTSRSSPFYSRRSWIRYTTSKRPRYLITPSSPLTQPNTPKTSELSRRIKDAEKAVKHLVTEDYLNGDGDGHAEADEAQHRHSVATQDAGSDDEDDDDDEDIHSVDALEDQFILLEEEVATLVADVHDLALYTKLNITGFMKILKVRHSHSPFSMHH